MTPLTAIPHFAAKTNLYTKYNEKDALNLSFRNAIYMIASKILEHASCATCVAI